MSQSTLTRRIQKLEKELGVVLFDRTTRTLRMTLSAKILRNRAQGILEDTQETVLAVRDETNHLLDRKNRFVSVAAVPSVSQTLLPRVIARFRTDGHRAKIRILDSLANDVVEAVLEGDADFGITSIPLFDQNLTYQKIADDPIVLAMHKDHPLVSEKCVRWDSIQSDQLIVPIKGSGNRMVIDEALSQKQRVLGWAYEVRRTTTAIALVEAGVGVAVVPYSALPQIEGASVVLRPLEAPSVFRQIGLVARAAQQLSEAACDLRDIMLESEFAALPSSLRNPAS